MLSLFSCYNRPFRRRQRGWKEKEGQLFPFNTFLNTLVLTCNLYLVEAAKNLDQLPSWTAPDNTLILQAFEWHVPADRRHWNRLKAALPDFKAIGVDQIWIPPGCKGMDPAGNGYDIYDLYDLGEFDQKGAISTKWGTRKELEDLVCQAQALDIKIIWDAVLNHKAGADFPESFKAVEVDPKSKLMLITTTGLSWDYVRPKGFLVLILKLQEGTLKYPSRWK